MRRAASVPVPSVPCPAAESRLWLPFLAVRHGPGIEVCFGVAAFWACLTHFDGRRTVYCPAGFRGHCERSCPKGKPRWTAYSVVCRLPGGRPSLVSWCAAAHQNCPKLGVEQGSLTRAIVRMERMDAHSNAPLCITWTGKVHAGNVPTLLDVREYLSRLWQVKL